MLSQVTPSASLPSNDDIEDKVILGAQSRPRACSLAGISQSCEKVVSLSHFRVKESEATEGDNLPKGTQLVKVDVMFVSFGI